MTAPPAESVIVPSLDSPWIEGTLTSLAREGAPGPEVEVIVVGRDAAGVIPRTQPGLRFLETATRLNPAAARNLGAREAHGGRLLFIDSDCLAQPGWRRALAGALDRAPIAGGAVTFDLAANPWALADNLASFHELLADRPREDHTQRPLGSLNLAVRRETWQALGGFDEALTTSEDFDWVQRARAAGFATAFEPAAVVLHAAVRDSLAKVIAHATWYGSCFHAFRQRHPGLFGTGPTWRNRTLFRLAALPKSLLGALQLVRAHRAQLGPLGRALPGLIVFKWAWYRAVAAHWPTGRGAAG